MNEPNDDSFTVSPFSRQSVISFNTSSTNADDSVRRNKGPARPITPEAERAEILAALECVDAVVIFPEDTPADIVRALQPDVLVKGADWPADQIVGRDTVEGRGGKVVRIPLEPGHSTSSLVERIKQTTRS